MSHRAVVRETPCSCPRALATTCVPTTVHLYKSVYLTYLEYCTVSEVSKSTFFSRILVLEMWIADKLIHVLPAPPGTRFVDGRLIPGNHPRQIMFSNCASWTAPPSNVETIGSRKNKEHLIPINIGGARA